MDMEVLWKAAFPRGSSRSSAAPASRGKAMPGTGTGKGKGDGIAGKVSPLAWRYEVLKPSRPPAGVSAGRISPTPVLDAAHKSSSHLRGPPTEKTKHMADKKFLEPFESMRQMLKEMLQGGQEVDGEAVLKAAFPEGSSVSSAGKEAMPDWDRDLDYLKGLLEYGLKFLEDAEDEPVGEGDLASKPTSRTETLGAGEDVSAGNTFQAPLLITAHKPSSHRRGPPTGKYKAAGHRRPHEPSERATQSLKEMQQGGQEGDGEAVLKAAFPEGSSVSSAGKEAMPDWDRDLDYLKGLLEYGLEFLEVAEDEPVGEVDLASQPTFRSEALGDGEGVSAGRISSPHGLDAAHKPGSHRRVVNQKSVQKEALPNGSTGSVPASTAGGTAMPGTGTGTGTGTGDAVVISRHFPYSHKGIRKGFSLGIRFLLGVLFGLFFLVFLLFCYLISISGREIDAPLDSR